jgi:hypothetical protein
VGSRSRGAMQNLALRGATRVSFVQSVVAARGASPRSHAEKWVLQQRLSQKVVAADVSPLKSTNSLRNEPTHVGIYQSFGFLRQSQQQYPTRVGQSCLSRRSRMAKADRFAHSSARASAAMRGRPDAAICHETDVSPERGCVEAQPQQRWRHPQPGPFSGAPGSQAATAGPEDGTQPRSVGVCSDPFQLCPVATGNLSESCRCVIVVGHEERG